MKHRLPGRVEFAIFAAMAVVCGLLVTISHQHDTMLFFCGMPVFLISALMGFRRSELQRQEQRAAQESESA
ncbi:MAG TPA: hypothetical protein VFC78_22445 [Tepidisphaeraceae bacterium]|nr:hypothetical protein [Tepidisphaeraceae bacterium]